MANFVSQLLIRVRSSTTLQNDCDRYIDQIRLMMIPRLLNLLATFRNFLVVVSDFELKAANFVAQLLK